MADGRSMSIIVLIGQSVPAEVFGITWQIQESGIQAKSSLSFIHYSL